MSDPGFRPWSDNPNAPKLSYTVYIREKSDLAGYLLTLVLYGALRAFRLHVRLLSVLTSFVRFAIGMLIVLFFKCMTALLNPVYRRGESTRWGLVSYTAVMFSLATVLTAMNLDIESIAHIDNRNFPGTTGAEPPGPAGYLVSLYPKAINIVPNVAFAVSNWLADGFLVSLKSYAMLNCPGV